MQQYKDIIQMLIQKYDNDQQLRDNRTNVKTTSVFGYQTRFDLQKGFPLVTLKFTSFKLILSELIWFLSGSTNDNDLRRLGQVPEDRDTIWSAWATEDGSLGPIYQHQWLNWTGEDGTSTNQIAELIKGLKENPYSRRHIVSAWNVNDLPSEKVNAQTNVLNGKMALAPCHTLFQFYVEDRLGNDGVVKKHLSCQLYQR